MAAESEQCWQYTRGSLQRIVQGDYAEVFSQELTEIYTQRGTQNNKALQRDIFSRYKKKNTSQLKYAWGRKVDAVRGSPQFTQPHYSGEMNTCWICGSHVFPGDKVMTSTLLGYPEAEHALFLKYGYAFLSLPAEIFLGQFAPWATAIPRINNNSIQLQELNWWTQEQINQKIPENIQGEIAKDYQFQIKLEMRQSHRLCNQLKSQFNYVRFNKFKREWKIKETLYNYTIKLLTETIENTLNYKENQKKRCNVLDFNRFRKSLEDIVNYLNFKMEGHKKPYFIDKYVNLPDHAKIVLTEKKIDFDRLKNIEKYIITRTSIKFVLADAKDNLEYRQDRFRDALDKVLGDDNSQPLEETEQKQMEDISRQIIDTSGKAGSESTVGPYGVGGTSFETPILQAVEEDEEIKLTNNQLINIDNKEVGFYRDALTLETQEPTQGTPAVADNPPPGSAVGRSGTGPFRPKKRPARGMPRGLFGGTGPVWAGLNFFKSVVQSATNNFERDITELKGE
tara:strand:+ start:42 stop:1568 length:1527 start_codon:yes stop_codon:yes gene_type:complete